MNFLDSMFWDLWQFLFCMSAVLCWVYYLAYRFAQRRPKAAKQIGKSVVMVLLQRYLGK
jgi:hypothetical protein